MTVKKDKLLTLGFPDNLEVAFGKVSFGAEPPRIAGTPAGLDFQVCGIVPQHERTVVYGLARGENHVPQVWRAETGDGLSFENSRMLFEAPPADTRWLAGDLALGEGRLLMLQTRMGSPPTKGHPFNVFSGGLDGIGWRRMNREPVYLGQDSFNLVWDDALERFVNYQISYQKWDKRYADNMPCVRRVLHIRTSADGLEWTPGGSFGVDGPHLPAEQLIVPDNQDTPDTEFYHFSAVDLDEFRAGIMVKYVPQPGLLPKCGSLPHGPFLGYEWWVSADGLNWQRPYRENSGLDHARHPFAYRLSQPIAAGDELLWPMPAQVYAMNRRRMFYAFSRANAEITTARFSPGAHPIRVEASFESERLNADLHIRQSYLMAELLDNEDRVLPGFEREKCVFTECPKTRVTLQWGDMALPDPVPDTVRLRLLFRNTRLFSVIY